MLLPIIFFIAAQVLAVAAGQHTVSYNWAIDWVQASPDGFKRPVVGINGQWPCPPIEISIGDEVEIIVRNKLKNETTAIHFHGLFQTGSNQMDGPAMVTQCPIDAGSWFTYKFTINQPGTYWYHAHIGGQYIDGLRGPIIVHDPAAPYAGQIDEERTLTVSDWYHDQAPNLVNYFQSPLNVDLHGGSEPVPNATLINESQNVKFSIKAGRTYLFHIINMGAFAAQYIQFDQHEMTVVEIDGVYTKPHKVQQLFLTVAQRYSIIIKAKANSNKNFAILTSMNLGMFDEDVIPPHLNNNATGWLVYDDKKPLPPPFDMQYLDTSQDDTVFVPKDEMKLLGPVTVPITLTVSFEANAAGQNRGSFNGISYVPQKVPTLYTALNAPANLVNNPTIYGVNSNPFILPKDSIVELTIINTDGGPHPFHLHSHNFQVIARSGQGPDDGPALTPPANLPLPKSPMRRDVVLIYGMGYAVVRFKADNPGITLFHCHIEWHVEAGLTATFIEAPTELQKLKLIIPDSHKNTCQKQGINTTGNAAGNSKDWLDLTGANTVPPLNTWGALINPPTKCSIRHGRLSGQ